MPGCTELRLKREEKLLEVAFDDGASFRLPAEYLRVESPSAEVQGHGPGQKVIVPARRHVGILRIEPVGHYAVRIAFDDLHDSGIY
ncbi:MAG: gamma-butyrobetaine hydroxylase-like domain-containing protein, partial [Acetobacteraceae bacterium]